MDYEELLQAGLVLDAATRDQSVLATFACLIMVLPFFMMTVAAFIDGSKN